MPGSRVRAVDGSAQGESAPVSGCARSSILGPARALGGCRLPIGGGRGVAILTGPGGPSWCRVGISLPLTVEGVARAGAREMR